MVWRLHSDLCVEKFAAIVWCPVVASAANRQLSALALYMLAHAVVKH